MASSGSKFDEEQAAQVCATHQLSMTDCNFFYSNYYNRKLARGMKTPVNLPRWNRSANESDNSITDADLVFIVGTQKKKNKIILHQTN